MCTATNLSGDLSLPWPHRPLQAIHTGFAQIAQPLNEHLAGEGASRKSEWVLLSEDALEAFQALK